MYCCRKKYLFSLKLAPLKFGALGGCLYRLCQEPTLPKHIYIYIYMHVLICTVLICVVLNMYMCMTVCIHACDEIQRSNSLRVWRRVESSESLFHINCPSGA